MQNVISTGLQPQLEKIPLLLNDGCGLAAYTNVDVLYQAYFTAYLVLNTINTPLNPGNPYNGSKTQNGFGTFGQPDIAATLAAVAREALKAVWYQKWYVHLRHRLESGGALVYLIKTGMGNKVQGHPSSTVLDSKAGKAATQRTRATFYPRPFLKVRRRTRPIPRDTALWRAPASPS